MNWRNTTSWFLKVWHALSPRRACEGPGTPFADPGRATTRPCWRCGLLFVLFPLTIAGCRQEMADQPSYRPLTQSDFFGDARSARPLEAGTVAHGLAPVDGTRWAGRKVNPRTAGDGVSFNPGMFVTDVPLSVTPELLERGQERYTIYCSVCHDRLGTGDGKIVQRGFTRPPSLLDDDSRGFKLRGLPRVPLREAPLGYFYEVISNGFGAMPDYAAQIPAHDRWAIVAYVRVLQISQRPTPEQTKKAASRARKSDPEKQP